MPLINHKETQDEFKRIKHYEIVTINHEQFHKIDDHDTPLYPMNGKIQFNAFGNNYELWARKHMELFGDNYHIRYHDKNGNLIVKHKSKDEICHYQAEIISDYYSPTRATFSVRKGRGFHGFIHAFNETIIIKPLNYLIKSFFDTNTTHRLDDLYIAYKYKDVDRSDYPHSKPNAKTCGHDEPKTKEFHERELIELQNMPIKSEKIMNKINWLKEHINMLDKEHSHEHNSTSHKHNIIIEDDYNYEMDVMANPFSNHALQLRKNMYRRTLIEEANKYGKNNRRYLQGTQTTRYVELLIVNDPGRVKKFLSLFGENLWRSRLEDDTIEITNNCNDLYAGTNWGTSVGSIQLSLQAIEYWTDWDTIYEGRLLQFRPASVNPSTGATVCNAGAGGTGCDPELFDGNPSMEVDFASYLSRFQDWRESEDAPAHDNAQLYSFYDFYQSVIGYASLPGMCKSSLSGGIEQATYGTLYNANIVAHEMGHNFNMAHDSSGNQCSQSDFIMAAVGSPYGNVPDSFSTCSIGYLQNLFSTYSMACLNNVPTESVFANCGNGLVEEGESCDCGKSDCSNTDACCNGITCALYSNAECSSNDACCFECKIASAGLVCNPLDSTNDCDISQEECDGIHAECPNDLREIEGTRCTPSIANSITDSGMCYNGLCISTYEQCAFYALQQSQNWVACDEYTSTRSLQCSNNPGITCSNTGSFVDEGTPCLETPPSQWITVGTSSQCRESSTQYTVSWMTGPWSQCTIECKNNANDPAGIQNRTVICARQDGVEASGCDSELKPSNERACNNVICNFCEVGFNSTTICGVNGICLESQKACQCNPGYSGEFCDVAPSTDWLGIVRHVYLNGSLDSDGRRVFIADRANPCGLDYTTYDAVGAVLTQSLNPGVSNITTIYIGSSVYLRWNTTGAIEQLAVGMIKVDENGQIPDTETRWPSYVGTGIAIDNQNCDKYTENSTIIDPSTTNDTSSLDGNTFDPCYVLNSCDDYHFVVPSDIEKGYYKIIVRFNNDFEMESDLLTVECHEPFCNQANSGSCNDTTGACECINNFYGDSCQLSNCSDWQYAQANSDAYGELLTYNKCFDSSNTCDDSPSLDITNTNDIASLCSCSDHFTGTYCETPIDHCTTFTSNPGLCTGECTFSNNECIYADCGAFNTQNECETMMDNGTVVARTISTDGGYPVYCEWKGTFCNRVTCPINLPSCNHGSVRRPLNEDESLCKQTGTNVYNNWYCDCTTMYDADGSRWKIPNPNDINALWSNTDATCSTCQLSCQHDSSIDGTQCFECQNCNINGIWDGVECNSLYWIISIRLDGISWDYAQGFNSDEFNELIVKDMAFYLNYDESKIEIDQIREENSKIIVYFRLIFDTANEVEAQKIGGDIVVLASTQLQIVGSPAYRGFLMQFIDNSYAFTWCVPDKEECDPDNNVRIMLIFWICLGSAFVLEVLLIIIYRIATRKQRQARYEQKVREVRAAQLKLMEHHERARRVGMRDVSKKRAKKIHTAKERIRRESELEMRSRAESDKNRHRTRKGTKTEQNGNDLGDINEENDVDNNDFNNIDNNNTAGNNADELPLPQEWKRYENDDGIPYYYNTVTGETSWIHPLQQ